MFVCVPFWLAANFYMLSHLIHFVKNFFQVFQSFFDVILRSRHLPFITQLCYYNTLFSFVKNFFQILSNFFPCCAALADSLRILAHRNPFVNHFFTKNRLLFCMLLPAHNRPLSAEFLPSGQAATDLSQGISRI